MKTEKSSSDLKISVREVIEKRQKYNKIQKRVKHFSNKNIHVNFTNTKYSKNNPLYFPYNFATAKIIVENCSYSTSIVEILGKHFFSGELNLFKSLSDFNKKHPDRKLHISEKFELENSLFVHSKLNKQEYFETLKVASWSYNDFVISAIYYYLEAIYSEYLP